MGLVRASEFRAHPLGYSPRCPGRRGQRMRVHEAPSSREQGVDQKLLRIYLRDHLAAAVGGAELARRTTRNNRGTPFAPPLEQLAQEIEKDRRTLEELMRRLGFSADPIKQAVVWAFEKVARLKPNGRVLEYSPLSRLIEFEALGSGIEGKRSMWAALHHIADVDERLRAAELAKLERRAADQRERLEAIRLEAARLALAQH